MIRVTRFFTAIAVGCSFACTSVIAQKGDRDFISMDARVEQLLSIIANAPSCEAVETALRLGMETLYGGLRPLPSRDLLRETVAADRKIAKAETDFAGTLDEFIDGGRCPGVSRLAVDLKFFVEQMNEVAVAVGRITIDCGVGAPCEGLRPILDEDTGHEVFDRPAEKLKPGFRLKLRSPFVPWNTVHGWKEDVVVTDPIPPKSCVAVFKETRGLMLRLHLVRIDVVRDPWATPMLARGATVPVWALEWVPSQYGKTWNICNDGTKLNTTVSQRVKQDVPLLYFWRYYGKAGHKPHKPGY